MLGSTKLTTIILLISSVYGSQGIILDQSFMKDLCESYNHLLESNVDPDEAEKRIEIQAITTMKQLKDNNLLRSQQTSFINTETNSYDSTLLSILTQSVGEYITLAGISKVVEALEGEFITLAESLAGIISLAGVGSESIYSYASSNTIIGKRSSPGKISSSKLGHVDCDRIPFPERIDSDQPMESALALMETTRKILKENLPSKSAELL